MISSEGTNTLLDLVDLYWVIQGYGGETASAIARLLQINKSVSINDAGGNIAAHQVDLSLTGRIELLKMLRRDIYHFGMGVDFDNDTLGTAPSGKMCIRDRTKATGTICVAPLTTCFARV